MRLRLQENPHEWLKFTGVAAVFFSLIAAWLWHRGTLPAWVFQAILAGFAVLLGVGLARPGWCRPLYRAGMTAGFWMGQIVGRVLLALCFVFLVIPIGLVLRLQGRDLLELRRDPKATSYWKPARRNEHLDRAY
jgi:hypothetical protein